MAWRMRTICDRIAGFPGPVLAALNGHALGGGAEVAERLSGVLGTQVPLLGTVPLDPALRAGGDAGEPVVVSAPESPAGRALTQIAQRLAVRPRGLTGRRLPVTPR